MKPKIISRTSLYPLERVWLAHLVPLVEYGIHLTVLLQDGFQSIRVVQTAGTDQAVHPEMGNNFYLYRSSHHHLMFYSVLLCSLLSER